MGHKGVNRDTGRTEGIRPPRDSPTAQTGATVAPQPPAHLEVPLVLRLAFPHDPPAPEYLLAAAAHA